jgi:hypothetical protein
MQRASSLGVTQRSSRTLRSLELWLSLASVTNHTADEEKLGQVAGTVGVSGLASWSGAERVTGV